MKNLHSVHIELMIKLNGTQRTCSMKQNPYFTHDGRETNLLSERRLNPGILPTEDAKERICMHIPSQ